MLKEINNFDLVSEIMSFDSSDEYYYLMILKRKKDQPEGTKNQHQSVRTIKTYCITSHDYLKSKQEEIMQLCNMFNARAYLYINKKSHQQTNLQLLKEIADRMISKQTNLSHIYDSAVGNVPSIEKRWIIDIDFDKEQEINYEELKHDIIQTINSLDPNPNENKIIKEIPTKNGFHLITQRFNSQKFLMKYRNIDIHKNNPTIIYIPKTI